MVTTNRVVINDHYKTPTASVTNLRKDKKSENQ